jgi:hypothetical protein
MRPEFINAMAEVVADSIDEMKLRPALKGRLARARQV